MFTKLIVTDHSWISEFFGMTLAMTTILSCRIKILAETWYVVYFSQNVYLILVIIDYKFKPWKKGKNNVFGGVA